jgi:hypothetical protein
MSESLPGSLAPRHSLEEVSEKVFANQHQLPVFQAVGQYAIQPPESFTPSQIAHDVKKRRGTNVRNAEAEREIQRLVDLDMATCLNPAAKRSRLYERVVSNSWEPLLALMQDIDTFPEEQLLLFDE